MVQRSGDSVICPCCDCSSPPGEYCVRCGSELASARRRYGANPHERAGVPHLVSTLFPALPRAHMRTFRLVLAGGALLTLGLALAGLFPLALTSAALLVPILTALYLWDVDVYEDQPWRVVAMTMGIGALAGVALGLVSQLVLPGTGRHGEDLLLGGVAIPALALVLSLAGPVALLLPRRTFNDVLDGVTFGAVSAAALTAAMALTRGAALLPGGLSPDGDTGEWVLRLAGLAIGMPVLAMCASGGAAGALWARYRAPLDDRDALGPLARPVVAIPAALALMVAGAVSQVLLPGALWLAVLVVLDAAGLLWLRRAIHDGLRQQSLEFEPGPPAVCRECGHATPLHAYCGHCGTARAALPKIERGRRSPLILVPVLVLAAGLGAATAGAAIADPGPTLPPCDRGEACGRPPVPQAPLVRETEVQGARLGWTGVYDPALFTLDEATDDGYDLTATESVPVGVRVRVQPGTDVAGALATERDRIAAGVLGLVDDTDPQHRVAGAMVGYRPARTLIVTGTVDTPQGPGDGYTAAVLGATDGRLTTVVTVSAVGGNADRRRAVMGRADVVLQGFRWTAGSASATADATAGAGTDAPSSAPRLTFAAAATTDVKRGGARPVATLVLRPRRAVATGGRPLSAAAIGRRFGPSGRQLAALRGAARRLGLTPLPVLPQRTVMRVSGPRRAVERAFGVRLVGRPAHPDRAPRLPPVLARHALAVTGLDMRPAALPAAFPAGGLRPVDARRVYGMDGLAARGMLGQGETIAVLSLDSFADADVAKYDRLVGIHAPLPEHVPVNGGTRVGSDTTEVNLDLDVIRGLVPRARLLNFEAPNRAGAFGDVIDAVVADGRAKVLSISWGLCERLVPAAERARDEAALRAAAAAGITVVVASGDSGAYECERFDPADQRPTVGWPAASRYALAVGGTTLRLDDQRRRASEAGWESPLSNAGGGGGVSAFEPAPPWQRTASGRREVPDVAAAADFRTGWTAVVYGEARAYGGTSAAAPFWAAAVTTVRQALRAAGRTPPASFAELLYALAARPGSRALHDVTVGGNRRDAAGPGRDLATGLGTPDVGALAAEAIAAAR